MACILPDPLVIRACADHWSDLASMALKPDLAAADKAIPGPRRWQGGHADHFRRWWPVQTSAIDDLIAAATTMGQALQHFAYGVSAARATLQEGYDNLSMYLDPQGALTLDNNGGRATIVLPQWVNDVQQGNEGSLPELVVENLWDASVLYAEASPPLQQGQSNGPGPGTFPELQQGLSGLSGAKGVYRVYAQEAATMLAGAKTKLAAITKLSLGSAKAWPTVNRDTTLYDSGLTLGDGNWQALVGPGLIRPDGSALFESGVQLPSWFDAPKAKSEGVLDHLKDLLGDATSIGGLLTILAIATGSEPEGLLVRVLEEAVLAGDGTKVAIDVGTGKSPAEILKDSTVLTIDMVGADALAPTITKSLRTIYGTSIGKDELAKLATVVAAGVTDQGVKTEVDGKTYYSLSKSEYAELIADAAANQTVGTELNTPVN